MKITDEQIYDMLEEISRISYGYDMELGVPNPAEGCNDEPTLEKLRQCVRKYFTLAAEQSEKS